MTEWWGITRENQLREYQKKTNQFLIDLESTLKDFENTANVKELSSKIKEAIKKFQESNN